MLQATSFAGQRRLAADYRDADIRRAARARAEAEAKRIPAVSLDDTRTAGPFARLLSLLPNAR
jgi:hypothetical protein